MKLKKQNIKLWSKDFIIIIVINFLVFLNHLMILSTFPFFVSYLGYSDSVSGACASAIGEAFMKKGFNVLWGRKHPSSITYKIKNNK